jgi:Apea-like HEPN
LNTIKINEAARAALIRKLIEAIKGATIDDVVFMSEIKFGNFYVAALKVYGKWLDRYDLGGIIARPIFKIWKNNDVATNINIKDTEIIKMAEEIVDFLETIPRRYEILFPLPGMSIDEDIILHKNISLVSLSPIGTLALLDENRGRKILYLKVNAYGYSGSTRLQSAMRDAAALMKRIIQIGYLNGTFIKRQLGIVASAREKVSSHPILEALVFDVENGHEYPKIIALGLGLSHYLRCLILNVGKKKIDSSWENFLPMSIDEIKNQLATSLRLIADEEMIQNTQSLRSALEWAFDAEADDEIVPSFIKTCIALEAILLDDSPDSDKGGLTERISDRCAYLLGNNPTERKELRGQMRQVYQLRSKFVHGKKSSLADADRQILDWGQSHLAKILIKEINALEKWAAVQNEK